MEEKQKDESIFLRVPPHVKELAEKEAANLGLSVNAFVGLLIQSYADGVEFHKKEKKDASK